MARDFYMYKPNLAFKRQKGVALAVGLVVLLVLTLIGVSSMSVTTLELRMASNLQSKNHAFQAAEAGLETTVKGGLDAGLFTGAGINVPLVLPTYNWVVAGSTAAVTRSPMVELVCRGRGKIENASRSCVYFELRAVGLHAVSSAQSAQIQGVGILGAGSGDGSLRTN